MFDLAPYVESWMGKLARDRPVFLSESDFQLALATVMADEVQQARLEKKVAVWFSIVDRHWPQIKQAFQAWLEPENFKSDGTQLSALRTR